MERSESDPDNSSNEEILLKASRFSVVRTSRPGKPQKEFVRHPGAVVILPMLPDDHICLIRNYRVSIKSSLVELPAGTRAPSEPPEQTAVRELAEETGYSAERLELLRTFYPSPGIMDECMYLYVASGLRQGKPAREPDEEIENLIVPWQAALEMVDRGEIRDAKTIVGLLTYERARSLRQ